MTVVAEFEFEFEFAGAGDGEVRGVLHDLGLDPARGCLVVLTFNSEWLLDPDRAPDLRSRLVADLSATLAHEAHHAVRSTLGPGWGDTLGEAIVSEGLAVAVEVEMLAAALPCEGRGSSRHAM